MGEGLGGSSGPEGRKNDTLKNLLCETRVRGKRYARKGRIRVESPSQWNKTYNHKRCRQHRSEKKGELWDSKKGQSTSTEAHSQKAK